MQYGKNIEVTQKGNKTTIVIDHSKEFGESKSGKSVTIATTGGNQKLENGITLGLNCYRKKD